MKKEELEQLLSEKTIKIDMFDERNGITINDKIDWAIESIIENNAKCPNCNEIRLTGISPTCDQFICEKCGNVFIKEDIIK